MKYHQALTRFVLLAGVFLLALSIVTPAQAREIWLNPAEAAKKPLGNWGAVPLKRSVHFNWHVPADFDTVSPQSGNGTILVIGLRDQDINYRINVSVAGAGEVHDTFQTTPADIPETLLAVPAGVLTEIPVTNLPDLLPGDYVAVSFERAKKVKLLLVGMRYDYVDQQQVLLAGVSRTGDDIFFDDVNVHIRNGLGRTDGDTGSGPTVNGTGNLIIGYDELRTFGGAINDKTGSHNLVIGEEHNYSSYGGLVAGFRNTVSGPGSSVSGGAANTASSIQSSVSGGD